MKQQEERDTDEVLVRYLLGQLPEAEQIELERRYFADDELFDRLVGVDADLTDAYVREELSPEERKGFERRLFSSPRRREKVEFATAWKRLAGEAAAHRPAAPSAAADPTVPRPARTQGFLWRAAAALLVAVAGSWLAFQAVGWREERARLETDRTSLRDKVGQLERELDQARANARRPSGDENGSPRGEPRTVSFTLVRGSLRDAGEPNRLEIPKGIDVVFLELSPEELRYGSYQAVIERVTGERLWEQRHLQLRARKDDKVVILTLAAAALPPGDYIVRLNGETPTGRLEELGSYSIHIARD